MQLEQAMWGGNWRPQGGTIAAFALRRTKAGRSAGLPGGVAAPHGAPGVV